MRRVTRLLGYVRPYSLQFFVSVLLMAAVGLLEAFRSLLLVPIIDKVLNPASTGQGLKLFNVPGSQRVVDLQEFIPRYFHNPLTVVALVLVAATLVKGVCDYLGTYLVNYAGFGLITDLRNKLYDRILRRSIAARLSIVELRLVCDEDGDYASETLLSHAGVRKVANVARSALYDISRNPGRTRVYF